MAFCAASLLTVLAVLRADARDDEGPGPLPWRVGGAVGFTVDAAAFPDSAGRTLDIYVRLPRETLDGLGRADDGSMRLRLAIRLDSRYGGKQHEAVEEFGVDPADSAGGFGKVVVVRLPTKGGTQRMAVKLEDLNTRKSGLGPMVRALGSGGRVENVSNSVKGEFELPAPQAGRELSDLEFVWLETAAAGASAFRRGQSTVLPNPERLYGLFQGDLHAYFTARGTDERPWVWIARVLDAQGKLVAQQESTAAASRWLAASPDIDLSHEPAGGYDLEVKAWQEGDPGALLGRSHFSVAWRQNAWLRNPRDVEDWVHLLLGADEEEAFIQMHPGEQERYMEDFWRVRDPTPETARNEARETYLLRVEYANRNFGRAGLGQGMFSDMGRTYIRYGPPADIYRQVIPAGDETLRQVIGELSLTEDRPVGEITIHAPGGDIRPWEVWVYEGNIPIPPDADPKVTTSQHRRIRLVFLFVDDQGLGDFRLRYSTE